MSLTKIGRYQILDELGRGAMSQVYRGFDPTIGRTVAIKTVPVDTTEPELATRFRREAQAAGILSHPNIVTIYDAGEDNGVLYIAMELVEGETIQQLLGRGPLPVEQVTSIVEQVSAALDHAHARQIIHRDIKPTNIMISQGHVKVMDFGIAKMITSAMTSTGQMLGTPSYISPEMVTGMSVDGRSDIFSLGVVLYEMLTGTKPFVGDNITAVLYKIIGKQPELPAAVNPALHPGLDYVVLKALAKYPAERYQSCAELIVDLKNHTALGEKGKALAATVPLAAVSSARSPTGTVLVDREELEIKPAAVPRTGRPALTRRSKSLALAAAALLVLGAGIFWQMRRAPTPTSSEPAEEIMQPAPSAPEPSTPAAATPRGTPPGRSRATSPRASTRGEVGRVVIHTEPQDARVLVNGEATPYRSPVNFALAPGRYQITVELSGFASQTQEVLVRENQMVQLTLDLEPND